MSGTRPRSPGFGRSSPSPVGGAAMQKQPEPSDGKPKVPDAGGKKTHSPHHSKRGKARFRDDKSKKHYHGTNSSRHNVKKFDNSLNRCDPFNLRKDSPTKSFPNFNQNKKDKLKHKTNESVEKIPSTLVSKDGKNVSNKNAADKIGKLRNSSARDSDESPFSEPLMIVDLHNDLNGKNRDVSETITRKKKSQMPIINKDFQTDTDMKLIDERDASGEKGNASNLEDRAVDLQTIIGELNATFKEYLQIELKFQPRIYFPDDSQRDEVTASARDGAVHVLRCLKVWYDLPTDVLFHAINLLDRFLTKMKVRLCHVSCISVSCMHIAILSHHPKLPTINTEDLVSISQCRCTARDVRRMSAVVEEKLGVVGESISSLHWLRLFLKLLNWATVNVLGLSPHFLDEFLQESEMVNRLEILSCDASCCNVRACELALVLICTQLDNRLTLLQQSNQNLNNVSHLMKVVEVGMELQRACHIGDDSFYSTHQAVICVLERYNTRQKTPHRQCLVWKLSSRTLKVLRPTDKLTSMLPTIQEQQLSASSPLKTTIIRPRSGSESSDDLNEDTKDWPTSPVVPVLCNNN